MRTFERQKSGHLSEGFLGYLSEFVFNCHYWNTWFLFWQYDRPITLVLDIDLQHITSVFVVVLPENVDPWWLIVSHVEREHEHTHKKRTITAADQNLGPGKKLWELSLTWSSNCWRRSVFVVRLNRLILDIDIFSHVNIFKFCTSGS